MFRGCLLGSMVFYFASLHSWYFVVKAHAIRSHHFFGGIVRFPAIFLWLQKSDQITVMHKLNCAQITVLRLYTKHTHIAHKNTDCACDIHVECIWWMTDNSQTVRISRIHPDTQKGVSLIFLTKTKLRPRYTWRDQDQQVCTCGKHTTEMVYQGKYMIIVDLHFHFWIEN